MQAQAIRSVRLIGKRSTLDLRVDHEDHNFYAEGVVVSNSHAIEYACLTAATVYLKARAPQAFYLSMLKLAVDEPDAIGYMNAVISEMRAGGIQLLPPDLLKSESDFTIQDGHVRFGLSHIKGISTATMAKVVSFKRDFTSKFDVFRAAKAAKLDIRTFTGLTMCGCLDSITMDGTSRAKLAFEAQLYNLLTDKEKLLVARYDDEYHGDLIELLRGLEAKRDEKGKPLIRDTRLATLRRDQADYWAAYLDHEKNADLTAYVSERHYLGWSFTTTLFDLFNKRVVGLTTIKDILARGGDAGKEQLKAAVWMGEGKLQTSAKGSPYYRCEVMDDSASLTVLLHGEERVDACKSYNGDIPKAGTIVTVTGSLSRDGKVFFAESIIQQYDPKAAKAAQDEVKI